MFSQVWQALGQIGQGVGVVGAGLEAEQMVVLDYGGVVESEAVVGAAAGADGVFFEGAQGRCCFAGVTDDGLGGLYGLDELVGKGGDSAEVGEEVQGESLEGQEAAGGAEDAGDVLVGLKELAVVGCELDAEGGLEKVCQGLKEEESGEDSWLSGKDYCACRELFVYQGQGGDVAWAEVLG